MNTKQKIKNEVIAQGESIIQSIIERLVNRNYWGCMEQLTHAQRLFQHEQSHENISICLSLLGVVEYLEDQHRYLKALRYINDAAFLANSINSASARLINEYALATIDIEEQNQKTATLHLKRAAEYAEIEDKYHLSLIIKDKLAQLRDKKNLAGERDPLIALLKIGQAVSAETDINALLKVIAEETKAAIQADRCSVFLYNKKEDELWSKVALGMDDSQEIRFPASKGLAGHVVKTGETINITDAYSDDRFNKEIDIQTGYKTNTILCMPIRNLNHEIIGAFQMLNKQNGVFSEEDEDLLIAIGSSAGIALENAQLFNKQQKMLTEQKEVFDSFIDTLAASIDARDKITAGHSSRVRMYAEIISNELNLDEENKAIIGKAATLHDIGKIGIRDSVLQKEGKLTDEEYEHIQQHAQITHDILERIHMSEDFKLVTEIACSHHEKFNGRGYYRQLSGEEIPFGGRILAVADVFDAITSKRHYRDKMPMINVIDILLKDSGSHFDGKMVDAFLNASCDKVVRVFLTENNLVLEEEHQKILEKYTMLDLHKFLTQENKKQEEEEKTFIDIFQFYYTAKSAESEM